jgi:4-amino-4-deoxy-L-arabinose transferase-like glycosyltransferase
VTVSSALPFRPASRLWRIVALAITIVGALAVTSTHFAFSNTYDEPAEIAAGVRWLTTHRAAAITRPPLASIAAAIGPFAHGARGSEASSLEDEGARILGKGSHYRVTLAAARLGELPFFLMLCGVVWAWGRRLSDERGAAIAVLLTASDPNLLAYAGLATPDIALAATITATLFAFVLWLEERSWYAAAALGVSCALALATDFSAVPMLALSMSAVYALARWSRRTPARTTHSPGWFGDVQLCLAVATALAALWGLYGFHLGAISTSSRISVPAAEWFRGFGAFLTDTSVERPAYLFGELSPDGWWFYYPVALLVKTPLPLLLLAVLGAAVAIGSVVRREAVSGALPLVGALAILVAVAITGNDSGIRQVLPVFALASVLGSVGGVALWEEGAKRLPARRLVRAALAAIVVGAVIIPMRAHPDHLAYFNPIAGDRPELVLVDSNLDWGQDLYRLSAVMKRMRIDSIAVAYYGSASFDAAGVRNARPLAAAERPGGWIAASQTMLAGSAGNGAYEWLNDLQPVGRVGASLVLYHVLPARRSR